MFYVDRIAKFISPDFRRRIIDSFPFRFVERLKLYNHELQINCELTTRCNTNCSMCSRSSLIKRGLLVVGDMNQGLIDKIVLDITQLSLSGKKIRFVPMGLGEPLMFKDLFLVFRRLRVISKNIKIDLVTNGIFMDDNVMEDIINIGIDSVSISLNSNTPAEYLKNTGTDNYNKVVNNIKKLILARNMNGKKNPNIFVQYLNFNDSQQNLKKSMKEWLSVMQYKDKCFIHPVVNHGGFCEKGNSTSFSSTQFPCSQPLYNLAIRMNGDSYPCCSSFYAGTQKIDSIYLGNLKSTSIYDLMIPKNNKQNRMINLMKKGDYGQLDICKKCNTYKIGCNYYFLLPKVLRWYGYKWL